MSKESQPGYTQQNMEQPYQSNPPYPQANPTYPQSYPPSSPYGNHPPPPPPYSPTQEPQHQPQTVTIVHQTPGIPMVYHSPLGPNSTNMNCQFCHAEIQTKLSKSPSMMAYVSGFGLCIIGCIFGCCLIPCCMDSCKTVEHTCPNCGRLLGKYSKYF